MTNNYNVLATRSGTWWTIEITSGLPDDMLGVSQTRRLNDVESTARSIIGDLLEIDATDLEIQITIELPDGLQSLVDLFADADVLEDAARSQAALARSSAASSLLDEGLTMREAGELLGLSHQRIKQLADRASGIPVGDLTENVRDVMVMERERRQASV